DRSLAYFDEKTQQIQSFPWPTRLPEAQAQIGGLFVRPNGDLLVCFQRHLMVIKPATGHSQVYRLPVTGNEWWGVNFAVDQQGTVYFDQNTVLYRFTDQDGPQVLAEWKLVGEQCASLMVDASDVLWVGTDGTGIRAYNLRANPFQIAPYRQSFRFDLYTEGWLGAPLSAFPKRNELTKLDNYNFRSTQAGPTSLWYSIGGPMVNRLNTKRGLIDQLPLPLPPPSRSEDFQPCPLATDPGGQVWAFYDAKVWQYNQPQQTWQALPYPIPEQYTGKVHLILVDEQYFWLATESNGLVRVARATGQLRNYRHHEADSTSLSSDALYSMAGDPLQPHRLWIGTFGEGVCVFDKSTGRSQRLTTANGLPNQVIYSLIPDHQGSVWMGTNQGICRINTRTLAMQTYQQQDGLLANEFNRFHYFRRPDGLIVMGGVKGITAFYPDQIRPDSYGPRTELTGLQLSNKLVEPGANSPLGWLPIQAHQQLTLSHDQNFLTVTFAALQFNTPNKHHYRYQLVGLNPTWVESVQPVAMYTDLRPGTYVLRLNATNSSGVWSPHIRTLTIRILPPFWLTWWAFALYALLLGGLLYGAMQAYGRRLRLRQAMLWQQKQLELNQQEKAQLEAVDEMKTRFFANITHEFRTPLSLILSPAQQLLNQVQDQQQRQRLTLIEANAHQLLQLINQLMELAKLEASVMSVQESVGDVTACVEEWIRLFAHQAEEKFVQVTLQSQLRGDYWFDVSKFERIVQNLLANALKFTPTGGPTLRRIALTLDAMTNENQSGIRLQIADSGIGIADQHLPHIFDRFYQANEVDNQYQFIQSQSGTGIGLALVKELIDLQGGSIQVESQLQVGTTFTIWLPYRPAGATQPTEAARVVNNTSPSTSTAQLLVIEDNADLADLICQSLPASYHYHRAENGAVGLERAFELMPDLIISDVMMPQLDGFTLCRRLKDDPRTNHIPVLLLTAKSSVESRLAGLSEGADDYLTKPFLITELQLRVHNLLERQRRIQERIQATLTQPSLPEQEPVVTESDLFMQHLYDLLEANLDNSTFGVTELATATVMSRTSLYRKVKALTGLTTSEVIRLYRLKKATQMLQQGCSIAETAYRVGFETPSHFSKVFRDQYQMTPTQFLSINKAADKETHRFTRTIA
ncbi:MAG TPA: ATP-binding protein, partial [Fibrella sp.]